MSAMSGNDISSKTAEAAWMAARFVLMEGQPHCSRNRSRQAMIRKQSGILSRRTEQNSAKGQSVQPSWQCHPDSTIRVVLKDGVRAKEKHLY